MKKIVIVGAGAAGYFAAGAIKRNLPHVDVTMVYDPNIPNIGVGESLGWHVPDFMKNIMGLDDEESWIKESNSTYKFGVVLSGFDGTDTPFMLGGGYPESGYGPLETLLAKSGYNLFDLWTHLKAKGRVIAPFNQYAAETYWYIYSNTMPKRYSTDRLLPSNHNYSYHVNATTIGDVIKRRVCEPVGVVEKAIKVRDVVLNSQGAIDHLLLDDESKEYADLFIDCTGFARILVNKLKDFVFEPSDEYRNDSAIVGPHKFQDYSECRSYTISKAMDWGWHFSVPSCYRSGEGYIFNSRLVNDVDLLVDEYRKKINKTDVQFRRMSWQPGYYNKIFSGNCVLLGLSAGFIDPFDSSGLNNTLHQIRTLVESLMQDHTLQLSWGNNLNQRYTQRTSEILIRIQGFLELATKNDTAYWQHLKVAAQDHDILNTLTNLITLPERNANSSNYVDIRGVAFGREALAHNTNYYNIPVDFGATKINVVAEELGMKFLNSNMARNRDLAATSISCADYYRQLFPNL